MSKKKIHINYPCQEEFNNMKVLNKKNRWCDKCSKKVTNYINENEISTIDSTCGLFSVEQVATIEKTSIIKSFVKPISLLSLLGVSFLPLNATAQETTNIVKQSSSFYAKENYALIKGAIKDHHSNEPLPFVNILVKHKDKKIAGGVTDFDGVFKISIDTNKYRLKDVFLEINSVGYLSDTTNLDVFNKELVIVLKTDTLYDSDLYINGGLRYDIED
jgi:hypothetical protein